MLTLLIRWTDSSEEPSSWIAISVMQTLSYRSGPHWQKKILAHTLEAVLKKETLRIGNKVAHVYEAARAWDVSITNFSAPFITERKPSRLIAVRVHVIDIIFEFHFGIDVTFLRLAIRNHQLSGTKFSQSRLPGRHWNHARACLQTNKWKREAEKINITGIR